MKTKKFIQLIAAVLVPAFLAQDLAFAAPELKAADLAFFRPPAAQFQIPRSVALVEEAFRAPSGKKTIYLIQDAHTNPSAQFNTAKALDLLLQSDKIKYVFLEAGTGDDSLSYLRLTAPLAKRERVARSFVNQGELSGSEYLDLTSEHEFVLWGIEDKKLYWESLEVYKAVSAKREAFQEYLKKVKSAVQTLKPKLFNPSLLALDEEREAYLGEKIPLTDYYDALLSEASRFGIPLSYFPHLQSFKKLKEKEAEIDFTKANEEQLKLIGESKINPARLQAGDHPEQQGFYALLEESMKDANAYPELSKYLAYLKDAQKIDPARLLNEQKILEEQIFARLVQTEDERELHRSSETLRFLKKLFDLTLTPAEFEFHKKHSAGFGITEMTGFLNRKIMDVKDHYERVVFLEGGYEEYLKKAERFYELTRERDQVFVRSVLEKMQAEGQTKAVLVTGGYHTPNLKALLKAAGVSYVSVRPQVTHETNHKRYEKLLLNQTPHDDAPAGEDKMAVRLIAHRAAALGRLHAGLGYKSLGVREKTFANGLAGVGAVERASRTPSVIAPTGARLAKKDKSKKPALTRREAVRWSLVAAGAGVLSVMAGLAVWKSRREKDMPTADRDPEEAVRVEIDRQPRRKVFGASFREAKNNELFLDYQAARNVESFREVVRRVSEWARANGYPYADVVKEYYDFLSDDRNLKVLDPKTSLAMIAKSVESDGTIKIAVNLQKFYDYFLSGQEMRSQTLFIHSVAATIVREAWGYRLTRSFPGHFRQTLEALHALQAEFKGIPKDEKKIAEFHLRNEKRIRRVMAEFFYPEHFELTQEIDFMVWAEHGGLYSVDRAEQEAKNSKNQNSLDRYAGRRNFYAYNDNPTGLFALNYNAFVRQYVESSLQNTGGPETQAWFFHHFLQMELYRKSGGSRGIEPRLGEDIMFGRQLSMADHHLPAIGELFPIVETKLTETRKSLNIKPSGARLAAGPASETYNLFQDEDWAAKISAFVKTRANSHYSNNTNFYRTRGISARDLFQEVMTYLAGRRPVLIKAYDPLKGPSFEGWLHVIVHHSLLNLLRKARRIQPLSQETARLLRTVADDGKNFASDTRDVLADVVVREHGSWDELLRRAIDSTSLTPKQKETLLRVFQPDEFHANFKKLFKKIAEGMSRSPSTIHNKVWKSLRMFKEHLRFFGLTADDLKRSLYVSPGSPVVLPLDHDMHEERFSEITPAFRLPLLTPFLRDPKNPLDEEIIESSKVLAKYGIDLEVAALQLAAPDQESYIPAQRGSTAPDRIHRAGGLTHEEQGNEMWRNAFRKARESNEYRDEDDLSRWRPKWYAHLWGDLVLDTETGMAGIVLGGLDSAKGELIYRLSRGRFDILSQDGAGLYLERNSRLYAMGNLTENEESSIRIGEGALQPRRLKVKASEHLRPVEFVIYLDEDREAGETEEDPGAALAAFLRKRGNLKTMSGLHKRHASFIGGLPVLSFGHKGVTGEPVLSEQAAVIRQWLDASDLLSRPKGITGARLASENGFISLSSQVGWDLLLKRKDHWKKVLEGEDGGKALLEEWSRLGRTGPADANRPAVENADIVAISYLLSKRIAEGPMPLKQPARMWRLAIDSHSEGYDFVKADRRLRVDSSAYGEIPLGDQIFFEWMSRGFGHIHYKVSFPAVEVEGSDEPSVGYEDQRLVITALREAFKGLPIDIELEDSALKHVNVLADQPRWFGLAVLTGVTFIGLSLVSCLVCQWLALLVPSLLPLVSEVMAVNLVVGIVGFALFTGPLIWGWVKSGGPTRMRKWLIHLSKSDEQFSPRATQAAVKILFGREESIRFLDLAFDRDFEPASRDTSLSTGARLAENGRIEPLWSTVPSFAFPPKHEKGFLKALYRFISSPFRSNPFLAGGIVLAVLFQAADILAAAVPFSTTITLYILYSLGRGTLTFLNHLIFPQAHYLIRADKKEGYFNADIGLPALLRSSSGPLVIAVEDRQDHKNMEAFLDWKKNDPDYERVRSVRLSWFQRIGIKILPKNISSGDSGTRETYIHRRGFLGYIGLGAGVAAGMALTGSLTREWTRPTDQEAADYYASQFKKALDELQDRPNALKTLTPRAISEFIMVIWEHDLRSSQVLRYSGVKADQRRQDLRMNLDGDDKTPPELSVFSEALKGLLNQSAWGRETWLEILSYRTRRALAPYDIRQLEHPYLRFLYYLMLRRAVPFWIRRDVDPNRPHDPVDARFPDAESLLSFLSDSKNVTREIADETRDYTFRVFMKITLADIFSSIQDSPPSKRDWQKMLNLIREGKPVAWSGRVDDRAIWNDDNYHLLRFNLNLDRMIEAPPDSEPGRFLGSLISEIESDAFEPTDVLQIRRIERRLGEYFEEHKIYLKKDPFSPNNIGARLAKKEEMGPEANKDQRWITRRKVLGGLAAAVSGGALWYLLQRNAPKPINTKGLPAEERIAANIQYLLDNFSVVEKANNASPFKILNNEDLESLKEVFRWALREKPFTRDEKERVSMIAAVYYTAEDIETGKREYRFNPDVISKFDDLQLQETLLHESLHLIERQVRSRTERMRLYRTLPPSFSQVLRNETHRNSMKRVLALAMENEFESMYMQMLYVQASGADLREYLDRIAASSDEPVIQYTYKVMRNTIQDDGSIHPSLVMQSQYNFQFETETITRLNLRPMLDQMFRYEFRLRPSQTIERDAYENWVGEIYLKFNSHVMPVEAPKRSGARLAAKAGPKLELMKNDEYVVSELGLQDILANPRKIAQRLQSSDFLGEPNASQVFTKTLGEGKNQVTFTRRKSGRNTVWSFKKKDLEKVKALLGIQDLEELKNDEYAMTRNGLQDILTNASRIAMRFQSSDFLGDPNASKDLSKTLGEGKNQVTFTLRKNDSRTIWSFKKKDFEKVKALLGIQDLEELKDDEYALSAPGLRDIFANSVVIAQRLQSSDFLGEPNASQVFTKTLGEGKNQVTFTRRKSGPAIIWCFKKKDFEKVKSILGVQGLEKLKDDEYAISKNGLRGVLADTQVIAQRLNDSDFLGDPNTSKDLSKTLGEGKNQVTFTLRKKGRRTIWSFKKKDFEKVKALLGVQDLEALKDDEYAVSHTGLQGILANSTAIAKVLQSPDFLGDPNLSKDLEKTLGKGPNQVTFTLRKNDTRIIWSFRNSDLSKAAALADAGHAIDTDAVVESENLFEVVSTFGEDPRTLYEVLLMTTRLSPQLIQRIVVNAYRGLRGQTAQQTKDYSNYTLDPTASLVLEQYPASTQQPSVLIKGKVRGNMPFVQIAGDRQRIVPVRKDGTFETRLILQKGQEINLVLFGFNDETQHLTEPVRAQVRQTSAPQDPAEALADLLSQRQDVAESLEKNSTHRLHLQKSMEVNLLKHFTEDEREGFKYLDQKIKEAKEKKNALMLRIYLSIREKFKKIHALRIKGLSPEERLFFYQKYAIFEIKERMNDPKAAPGVVLALEQGLGKSVVFLSLARDFKEGALIVTPNSVVTSIDQQEDKFFEHPRLDAIVAPGATEKTNLIKEANQKIPVSSKAVNIEFLRADTHDRFGVLNQHPEQLVVIDESQFLNRTSLQSEGAQKLKGSFYILSSATPIAKVQDARSVMGFLERRRAFQDARVFQQLFNRGDPESLRLLHFFLGRYLVRIKKKDVFHAFDPKKPLELQKDRLPEKKFIDPHKEIGAYELTDSQAQSNLLLFTQWDEWQERQRRQKRTLDDEDLQRRQRNPNYFSKLHSTLQIENNPAYFGSKEESPKHRKMDEILKKEIDQGKGKVVIFTRYKQEVKDLLKRYQKYGAVSYYGDTGKGRTNAKGYLTDEKGKELRFRKVRNQFEVGPAGKPVLDPQGEPMTPLDYNRFLFQNDPNTKVIIATYDSGAVGVTFTGASAVIRDNLARDYPTQYQADDRINRIDNERKHYESRYYTLVPTYPKAFLERMKTLFVVRDQHTGSRQILPGSEVTGAIRRDPDLEIQSLYDAYFRQGTFTEHFYRILEAQKRVFDLVLDGIQSEDDFELIESASLKQAMPFLFENGKNGALENGGPTPSRSGARLAAKEKKPDGPTRREILGELAKGFLLCFAPLGAATYMALRRTDSKAAPRDPEPPRSTAEDYPEMEIVSHRGPWPLRVMIDFEIDAADPHKRQKNVFFASFAGTSDTEGRQIAYFPFRREIKILKYKLAANGELETLKEELYRAAVSGDKDAYRNALRDLRGHFRSFIFDGFAEESDQKVLLRIVRELDAELERSSGARLAVEESLARFGIGVTDGKVNLKAVSPNAPWVMTQLRLIEKGPIFTDPAAMPDVKLSHELSLYPRFPDEGTNADGVFMGLAEVNGAEQPVVVKLIHRSADNQIFGEIVNAQAYDRLGIGPRFYGVVRDKAGRVTGYAMQLVLGRPASLLMPPQTTSARTDVTDIRNRAYYAGLFAPAEGIETPFGRLVAIDAGDNPFKIRTLDMQRRLEAFLKQNNGARLAAKDDVIAYLKKYRLLAVNPVRASLARELSQNRIFPMMDRLGSLADFRQDQTGPVGFYMTDSAKAAGMAIANGARVLFNGQLLPEEKIRQIRKADPEVFIAAKIAVEGKAKETLLGEILKASLIGHDGAVLKISRIEDIRWIAEEVKKTQSNFLLFVAKDAQTDPIGEILALPSNVIAAVRFDQQDPGSFGEQVVSIVDQRGARRVGDRGDATILKLGDQKIVSREVKTSLSETYLVKVEQLISKGLSPQEALDSVEAFAGKPEGREPRLDALSYLVFGRVLPEAEFVRRMKEKKEEGLYALKNLSRAFYILSKRSRHSAGEYTFGKLFTVYLEHVKKRGTSVEGEFEAVHRGILNRVLDIVERNDILQGARLAAEGSLAREQNLEKLIGERRGKIDALKAKFSKPQAKKIPEWLIRASGGVDQKEIARLEQEIAELEARRFLSPLPMDAREARFNVVKGGTVAQILSAALLIARRSDKDLQEVSGELDGKVANIRFKNPQMGSLRVPEGTQLTLKFLSGARLAAGDPDRLKAYSRVDSAKLAAMAERILRRALTPEERAKADALIAGAEAIRRNIDGAGVRLEGRHDVVTVLNAMLLNSGYPRVCIETTQQAALLLDRLGIPSALVRTMDFFKADDLSTFYPADQGIQNLWADYGERDTPSHYFHLINFLGVPMILDLSGDQFVKTPDAGPDWWYIGGKFTDIGIVALPVAELREHDWPYVGGYNFIHEGNGLHQSLLDLVGGDAALAARFVQPERGARLATAAELKQRLEKPVDAHHLRETLDHLIGQGSQEHVPALITVIGSPDYQGHPVVKQKAAILLGRINQNKTGVLVDDSIIALEKAFQAEKASETSSAETGAQENTKYFITESLAKIGPAAQAVLRSIASDETESEVIRQAAQAGLATAARREGARLAAQATTIRLTEAERLALDEFIVRFYDAQKGNIRKEFALRFPDLTNIFSITADTADGRVVSLALSVKAQTGGEKIFHVVYEPAKKLKQFNQNTAQQNAMSAADVVSALLISEQNAVIEQENWRMAAAPVKEGGVHFGIQVPLGYFAGIKDRELFKAQFGSFVAQAARHYERSKREHKELQFIFGDDDELEDWQKTIVRDLIDDEAFFEIASFSKPYDGVVVEVLDAARSQKPQADGKHLYVSVGAMNAAGDSVLSWHKAFAIANWLGARYRLNPDTQVIDLESVRATDQDLPQVIGYYSTHLKDRSVTLSADTFIRFVTTGQGFDRLALDLPILQKVALSAFVQAVKLALRAVGGAA